MIIQQNKFCWISNRSGVAELIQMFTLIFLIYRVQTDQSKNWRVGLSLNHWASEWVAFNFLPTRHIIGDFGRGDNNHRVSYKFRFSSSGRTLSKCVCFLCRFFAFLSSSSRASKLGGSTGDLNPNANTRTAQTTTPTTGTAKWALTTSDNSMPILTVGCYSLSVGNDLRRCFQIAHSHCSNIFRC